MVKNKIPFSWKAEKYTYNAIALRDDIKCHKAKCDKPWSLPKKISIRIAYIISAVTALLFCLVGCIWQWLYNIQNH